MAGLEGEVERVSMKAVEEEEEEGVAGGEEGREVGLPPNNAFPPGVTLGLEDRVGRKGEGVGVRDCHEVTLGEREGEKVEEGEIDWLGEKDTVGGGEDATGVVVRIEEGVTVGEMEEEGVIVKTPERV